jgi:hypothetical protein
MTIPFCQICGLSLDHCSGHSTNTCNFSYKNYSFSTCYCPSCSKIMIPFLKFYDVFYKCMDCDLVLPVENESDLDGIFDKINKNKINLKSD